MDGVLFWMGPKRFRFVYPDGDLDTWLLAHRPGFSVTVTDPQSRVLQVQGSDRYRAEVAGLHQKARHWDPRAVSR